MTYSKHPNWDVSIGLEIHVELNTRSKLFSTAQNRFGDEPNTNISPVCTGQPGALPILNREAVSKAVLFGCAIESTVQLVSRFDRKSYFYPDSPRNFQITQYEEPLLLGGFIEAPVEEECKRFEIDRVHLEDDAGMLKHFSSFAGIDDNRAGLPLIEIVSRPCIHTPKEATAYATAIKEILEYLDVSDCNMEEGSLRMDVNVSVRPKGETHLRNKVEIKNMNSFTNMELAIVAEIKRQIREYEANPDRDPKEVIQQGTSRWDPERQEVVRMREKENAADYRYFPEPDLPPIVLKPEYVDALRQKLPELPQAKRKRYREALGLSPYNANPLTLNPRLSRYFEEALQFCSNAQGLANWITVEFAGRYKESGKSLLTSGITAQNVAKLIAMIDSGKITGKIAKSVADEMVATDGRDCAEIVAANPDYQPVHDSGEIETLVDQVLAANQNSIADFRAGKERAFGFLVGQVMKLSRGKASPQVVNDLLRKKLSS